MRLFYQGLYKKAGFALSSNAFDPLCFAENVLTFSSVEFKDYRSPHKKYRLSFVALAVAALIKSKLASYLYK
jgi:hypothetical protein